MSATRRRPFARLAAAAARQWDRARRSPAALPEIAAEALRGFDAHGLDLAEIAGLCARDRALPKQFDAPFGDAQVTVGESGDLIVQLIYWLDETTPIHQHAFAGAFRVLAGASFHTTYTFRPRHRAGAVLLGELAVAHQEVLSPGDIREIGLDSGLIHNLAHLEHPSVTLTVRSRNKMAREPQWNYYYPGVAVDPYHRDAQLDARLRLLEVHTRLARRPSAAARVVIAQGLYASWRLLTTSVELGRDPAEHHAAIRAVHGARGVRIVDAFTSTRMRYKIGALRRQTRERPHRTFLALLADTGDRTALRDALVRMFPRRDPAALVETWMLELAPAFGLDLEREDARAIRYLFAGMSARAVSDELSGYTPGTVRALRRALASSMFAPVVA